MHNSSFCRIEEANSRHGSGRFPSLLLCSALALSSLMLSGTFGRSENLLVNGSFEQPGGLAPSFNLYIYQGDTNLIGWTVGGTGV
jgi:hypothetical protein